MIQQTDFPPESQSSAGLLIPPALSLTVGSSVLERITQVGRWCLLCGGAQGWAGWIPPGPSDRTFVCFPLSLSIIVIAGMFSPS